jgi:hypothetical protein
MNDPDAAYCELDGTPLAGPVAPPPMAPIATGALVMPDQTEITLPQTTKVFGRNDFVRYAKSSEDAKQISRAHFTITQENGEFYLHDGGPDPHNAQAWKSSINQSRINGVALSPGAKQKLNNNDTIDVAQLGYLTITFKCR